MEPEILGKIAANSPGVVGIIIVVYMFLKALKHYVDQIHKLGDACHQRSADDQIQYREHVERLVARVEMTSNGYHEAMTKVTEVLAKNGATLERMEKALKSSRRRNNDWEVQTPEATPK